MARPSPDVKPGPPEWSKGCVTLPLTVGEDLQTQAGLITFPKEMLSFFQEGHTFTLEGRLSKEDVFDKNVKTPQIVTINITIDGATIP